MHLRSKELRIEVTSKCNAHCTICPREKMTRPLVTMPTPHFEYLVSQGHRLDVSTISLFGHGEPLLDADLPEKVSFCARAQFDTFITTNGALLTPNLSYELLTSGLSHLRISAHGVGENYNAVHRGLKWERLVDHLNMFLRTKKALAAHCTVSISVIPMHGETVDEIRTQWEPFCDFLEIWRPHNWADGRAYRAHTATRKKTCGRPASGPVQIQADGKMIVCCWDYDGKMVVGDTYQNTIEEILQCDAFDRIRRQHEDGDHTGLLCASCDQLFDTAESPLLYSNRDAACEPGRLSSTKRKLA